jgi:hypothetical protein
MKKHVVMMVVLSLLASGLFLAGCGSGSSSTSSSETPEGVAKAFWKASLTGDAATSWDLLSQQLKTSLKNEEAWAKAGGVSNTLGSSTIEAGKATVKGDEATVEIKIMNDGKEVTTQEVTLVKEDGAWKVLMP